MVTIDRDSTGVTDASDQRNELGATGTGEESAGTRSPVSRRTALGLLTLGGLGLLSDPASASLLGQAGRQPSYDWKEDVDANGHSLRGLGSLTMGANRTSITDFAGANLSVGRDGVLNATVTGVHTSVSDDGRPVVDGVRDVDFGRNLSVSDDGDDTVTVDVDARAFAPARHTHDNRYYTESESTARFVEVAGDTMAGDLDMGGNTLRNGPVGTDSVSSQGDLTLDSDGTTQLESGQDIDLESARNTTLSAGQDVDLESALNTALSAGGNVTLEAAGTVDVGGTLLRLNGDTVVDGNLAVTSGVKNFVQTVSTNAGPREVVYTAVEAARVRTEVSGVATLVDGEATVELPEHFGLVTSGTEPLLVQVTPCSADSLGLAVTDRSRDQFVVRELGDGTGTYEFAYTVKGVRRGYENEEVLRDPVAAA